MGALPGRTTIVVSRRGLGERPAGVEVAPSVPEALDIARRAGETEAFIVGGAEIYRAGLDYADRMYLTRIDRDFGGDTVFPAFDADEWVEVEAKRHDVDEKNAHAFTFVVLERRAEAGFGC
jgi:dihydrofolate reductase